ncbi:MAG: hypothetical protein H7199_08255 [Burkholderiales bacterium]|nr:hypothetical protein [Flavobacterium sp.]
MDVYRGGAKNGNSIGANSLMMPLKKTIANHLVNSMGWTTKQKIVVFESDDWGSIRMPSTKAYDALMEAGILVDRSPYCRYDNLCSAEDIESLFAILRQHKDANGQHPMITANAVVTNPNFEKIASANYDSYHYETIDQTLARFFPNHNPFSLWNQGLQQRLFIPQFHGREHVNVPFWLDTLKRKDPVFTKAFEHGCWGISADVYTKYPKSIQASFDYNDRSELNFMKASLVDGLNIFEKLFHYRSESFIPNNYIWTSELDETLIDNGVRYMQGMKYQLLPKPAGETKRQMSRRFNGQKSAAGLLQTVRNVQFEPSLLPNNDRSAAVRDCLNQIQTAFLWRKPAIVSVHRINFCGALHVANREINLKLFHQLLREITRRWPDVVFMDTVSLAKIIK